MSQKTNQKTNQKTSNKKPAQKAAKSVDWSAASKPVLFRPDRLKYVRRIERPPGCPFCHALETGVSLESLLLYKNSHAMVIMNKFPYNPGHLLVLPRRHVGDILELSSQEISAIALLVQKSIELVLKANAAPKERQPGFNVGLNLGSAAGAGIPEHLHYHIVPRWNGDTNFFPLIAGTKVLVETLEQTFQRLLPYFDEYSKSGGEGVR